MKKIPQDITGTIAILKFPRKMWKITKKLQARKFLKNHKNVTTVVEKTEGFSGKLRIPRMNYLAGIKTTIAQYKENDCTFEFDINKTYFSPRLSEERKKTAEEVIKSIKKKSSKILVLFAGIAPYPIVIAKKLKKQKISSHIFVNELNKDANKFAEKNIRKNKVGQYITLAPGDAKTISNKLKEKFDIILMTRPNLKNTFLKEILPLTKKGTKIFYHGFGIKEEVTKEIKKDIGTKIKNIELRKAGDIGAYKYRWLASFEIK
ncbi:hypothetical protein HN604_01340 [archaeon]|jgi:tRNA (guanine37-N1)-methyltransferase|nr:hypothetical protein [archaeon]MBT6182648.1 hypothetical protein [archaeon]MBT6606312.1 hypothetical protein [archaeon]MBT7251519.1 hypothetical protein [archaeon]MBT7660708.1 hypothetical protein [archaeon]